MVKLFWNDKYYIECKGTSCLDLLGAPVTSAGEWRLDPYK